MGKNPQKKKKCNNITTMFHKAAKHFFIGFAFILFVSNTPFALPSNNPSITERRRDCRVVETMNFLGELKVFPDTTRHASSTSFPVFPDLVYEYRIVEIDNISPIDFDYNPYVKRYIDIYTLQRREQVSKMMGLADLYFPLFEEYLNKYNLPLELKYLAVVESALNPLAVSPSGAVGLWQFKIDAGRMFDLEVNSFIDQRMDPVKSTEAACVYLEYLYRIFNNWHLALAAYNAGPGSVRNAIQRSGGETNFWKIYNALPEAAQNYVPAFIAAGYVFRNAENHGIKKIKPTLSFAETDTVMVRKPVYFSVIAQMLDVPEETILFLNPMYRQGFVPKASLPASIRLPISKISQFIGFEEAIYEGAPIKLSFEQIQNAAGNTKNKVKHIHTIIKGEYLHKIAIRYGCTIDDLQIWNPALTSDLVAGQEIVVWITPLLLKKLNQQAP
jgi:membrane-bound lytic murein transglycosylase D